MNIQDLEPLLHEAGWIWIGGWDPDSYTLIPKTDRNGIDVPGAWPREKLIEFLTLAGVEIHWVPGMSGLIIYI